MTADDNVDPHKEKHSSAPPVRFLIAGSMLVLLAAAAAVDLIPLMTRSARVDKFQGLAQPGDSWPEARKRIVAAGYSIPTAAPDPIQIVKMDTRIPTLLKWAYTAFPPALRRHLPAAYRDAWISVNALQEIHNVRVLRPGYSILPMSASAYSMTTTSLARRRAAGIVDTTMPLTTETPH